MSNVASEARDLSTRFLKVRDLADLLDVPVSSVYEMTRQGRIPAVIRFGRHIRYDRDVLERWLKNGGEKESA